MKASLTSIESTLNDTEVYIGGAFSYISGNSYNNIVKLTKSGDSFSITDLSFPSQNLSSFDASKIYFNKNTSGVFFILSNSVSSISFIFF